MWKEIKIKASFLKLTCLLSKSQGYKVYYREYKYSQYYQNFV